ncbi:putative glycogen phosphorylase [Janibacter sp. HTCC2649]|uniref:alpha-glucan family phosphorylase n=1 Tax=Janibacter sp. HTCC2649 TaxID=313589 RepID=UPI00006708CD|nr:alpha-glucan family phosphorylase [Janibacter sp. HTCC2649]EAP99852.1 putative glycogen phosphorylase [Janibacter sp. HTCC2649]
MKAIRRFSVRPVLPTRIAALGDLAMNLRWSWHPPLRDLFESIDPERWASVGSDPVAMLSATPVEELDRLAADDTFVARVEDAKRGLDDYLGQDRWYQQWATEQGEAGAPAAIAYFSPEFGIAAALPQYSGGLGILAGDHLKAASDIGLPIVGVGLFYKTGYFRQSFNRDGWQQEDYPVLDPDGLPLALLREEDGTPSVILIKLPGGRELRAQVWRAQVGRVPLLLLDSDIPGNDDAARAVTERLYGGGGEQRLQQEMLLGVGGVRALRLWSRLTGAPTPDVYHSNEGHAGFLAIERISELVTSAGLTFDEALEAVRGATVFTTHTPVPAGIDRFERRLIEIYFGGDLAPAGVPLDRLLSLGAETYEGGDASMFNMAVLGLRIAQRANGVSKLHGVVSRDMFDGLFPGFDADEVPITSITNGVHGPTWVDRKVYELAARHSDDVTIDTTVLDSEASWNAMADLPRDEVWAVKRQLREQLVVEARARMRASWIKRGASSAELGWTDEILDPDVLTIGFARRVPTYKRLTLMLRDPARLKKLLLDPERPIQIVIAGKSHPADETGKQLIQQMIKFTDDPEVRHRIAFLPNYDIAMAQHLYPGCDVWLNNPLRPFEASGTSGMKAALNGALNLSILDGWWDEWFDGNNGWAIPTADGVEDPERRDDIEANALYDLIENQVAPRFYDVDGDDLPQNWLAMVMHTVSTLGPKVRASRMVREYTERLYVPAARSGWALKHDDYAGARDLAAYTSRVKAAWPKVSVDHIESSGVGDSPEIGETLHVNAYVSLDGLAPEDVEVQVAHGRTNHRGDDLHDITTMALDHTETYEHGRHQFSGDLTLNTSGAFGYTVRVLPKHAGLAAPASLGLVATA